MTDEKQSVEAAAELEKVLVWLTDETVERPSDKDAIASLALCEPLEVVKLKTLLAARLGIPWQTLKSEITRKRKHNKDNKKVHGFAVINTEPGNVNESVAGAEKIINVGLKYFVRNNELVNTSFARETPDVRGLKRDNESVIIQRASNATIYRDLDLNATFTSSKGLVHCPGWLPDQLHDRVRSEVRSVPYPTLDMVTCSPVILPSGKVSAKPFEEGVRFIANKRSYPDVPENPTKQQAVEALNQFEAIFSRFPFVDSNGKDNKDWKQTASYSVVLSSILSIVARPYLRFCPVPLIAVNAPTPRYGKTKVAKAAVVSALSYEPTTVHFTDEDEFGKLLLPLMRAGDRATLIDNVEHTLISSKLCILVTEGVMYDRILGESTSVRIDNNGVFFATGNNLTVGGDLATRTLCVNLDQEIERPETRSFDFDPVGRAAQNHPQLCIAACTAIRAFLLAGSPWTLDRSPWGGFVEWDKLVSGCLTWLGYADPYRTRDRAIGDDPIRTSNLELLQAWHEKYGNSEVSLGTIRSLGAGDRYNGWNSEDEVYRALLKNNMWDGHHAQWVLRKLENKVIGGYRLKRCEGRSKFRVDKLDDKKTSFEEVIAEIKDMAAEQQARAKGTEITASGSGPGDSVTSHVDPEKPF